MVIDFRSILLFFLVLFLIPKHLMASQLQLGEIIVDGVTVDSLAEANKRLENNSTIYLGPGVYTQGLLIDKDNVIISGSEGTHFLSAVIQDKGTFVISGNNITIENIRCSGVEVADRNGSCIRHHGGGLTVRNVYFHDSEQGILAHEGSKILIEFSRFENLGAIGRAHAIYSNGEFLQIRHSEFLSSKDEGHEIKSRAKTTIIEHTVIANQFNKDSRLIDIPNGGELILRHSVLVKGPNSSNQDLIGYGLEVQAAPERNNKIVLEDNIFIFERIGVNRLLHPNNKLSAQIEVRDNLMIGAATDSAKFNDNNVFSLNRKSAKIAPFPHLPQPGDIEVLKYLNAL